MRDDDYGSRGPRARERRTWREIDNARGGRRDRDGRGGRYSDGPSAAASKSYRAQLEKLFDRGEAGKLLGDRAQRMAPSGGTTGSAPASSRPSLGPGETGGETKLALIKAVKEAIGREAITRAVDALTAKFPLPDDLEVLEQVLEHSDKRQVAVALQRLLRQLERVRPKRARTMLARVRTIEETSGDAELSELAVRVRNKLLA